MRPGILYNNNEIQEVNHPDRNTMQLVLPEAFRKQTLWGCHDDLGHFWNRMDIRPLKRSFLLAWNA